MENMRALWMGLKASGWTLECRAKQRAAIARWKPWERSTGPRTAEGTAVASRNADRGGSREMLRALARRIRTMMADMADASGG